MSFNTHNHYPLNRNHVKRIQDTLNKSLNEYSRTFVLRVDLRLPESSADYYNTDSSLITRFIASLKAQIEFNLLKRQNAGKRIHPCGFRYIWAREFSRTGKKHYHVALLLNRENYAYPGNYRSVNGEYSHNLALMIMEAWVRALELNHSQYYSLVEFPENGYYHLSKNSADFTTQYAAVTTRINYLAKEFSKDYSDGQRNFGCSQY
ncbi:inovirus Gp2 family protein [Raoultella ornithinolytica]|uniref:inovirus Gp2 family protein n=1 Tax=Raoultella ornithinolytica TaxID=54291 RepID=UPI0021AFF54F|nr:inovirus Gp2 family protein [Raoultella ornithinolytica]MCT4737193.1 inovirus Gp2 family protein [Raoultella ornithinolytica]